MFKYIAGVLFIIVLALGGATRLLLSKNQALKVANAHLTASVNALEGQRKEDQVKMDHLNDDNRKAREESQKLRDVFAKHNMAALALRKPGLIEKVINKGTKDLWRDFRSMTNPEGEKAKTTDEKETTEEGQHEG